MRITGKWLVSGLLALSCICSCHREKPFVIGVSQCSDDLWRRTVNEEIQRQASFMRNLKVIIKSANDDSEEQIRQIEEFMDMGVNLLIVAPNESAELNDVITKVFNNRIPVVLLDRRISSESYTAYVGADNRQLAERLGIYAVDKLLGKGRVAIIRGLEGSTADQERYEGFRSVIDDNPSVEIVGEGYGNFLKDMASTEMERIIHSPSGNEIDLVFAMNDQMAIGVRETYRMHPELRVPIIIGIDALPGEGGGIDAIDSGQIDASFMYPTGGYKVIEVASNILNGQPFLRENILNTAVIDNTNVRIIKMQVEQIYEQQNKVDVLSKQREKSETAYARQKSLAMFTTSMFLLLAGLFVVLWKLVRKKNKLNVQLKEKNDESGRQVETLKSQQAQLLELSKQLEEATQAKLVFFTDITHEFKTPLTLILGPIEEMLRSGRYSPENYEMLQIVQKNGRKLMNLLNQILEFRTYENGKMKISAEVGTLDSFLSGINLMFKPNMTRKNVKFEYLTDGDDYTMAFDKDKIDKIYFNLLSNALKYVEPGGKIKVKLHRKTAQDGRCSAVITVFNTDSFIPEDKLKDVFRRFYHLDDRHENSGIGLALSKSLIEAHGGTIEVSSSEKVGTTFIVTIPMDIQKVPENGTGMKDEHEYIQKQLDLDSRLSIMEDNMDDLVTENNCRNQKILIIEDNADMRQYIKLVLSNNYLVIQAADGKEGIKKAVRNVPDLILTDILMPGMDGFEVCKELKSNKITKNIPIICLTACASDEQKIQSYASGADGYMTKPFNANVLRVRISTMIEKNRSLSEEIENEIFPGKNINTMADKQRKFMEKFKAYVEAHMLENICVDDISRELGVSKSGLYRQLKEITDYNPVDLISLIKLKKGIRLILLEQQTITEAAYATGFSSSSYFTKTFVKYYQETPSEYIRRYTMKD